MQWFPLGSDRAKEVDFGIGSDAYSCLGTDDRAVLASDLMDRGLIACRVTDTHGATQRELRCDWDKWGESLLKEDR